MNGVHSDSGQQPQEVHDGPTSSAPEPAARTLGSGDPQEKLVCLHLLEGPLQVLCRMCQRSLTRLPLPHRWTVTHTGQFLLKEWFGAARVYDSEICGIGSGHPEQLAERAGNARWV